MAYIENVPLTRRQTRTVLRAVIPLLALVWASLPLHHCNVAMAGQAGTVPVATTAADAPAPAPHCHQIADPAPQADPSVPSCSDLGRTGPDLRPALAVEAALAQLGFDPQGLDPALQPVSRDYDERPLGDGRRHLRRLHLQKSVLLI